MPPRTRLRVGEAIMTGTIPGGGGEALGLRRPFRINAEVCHVRETTGGIETIVKVGSTCCTHDDLRPVGGREAFAWSSSEMSAVRFAREAHPPVPGDELSFVLGFDGAVRAMTRRDVVPRYRIDAAPRERRLLTATG